ncbi:MAG: cytochrome c [Nitrospirae bacterium]|nr:cytochrome c [Nitrospirota bacterium]
MDKRINAFIAAFVICTSMLLASVGMAVEDPTTKPGFYPPESVKKKNPLPLSLDTLREGRQIYAGHCQVCHGALGDGQGDAAVIAKYDPMPRNFTDADLMEKKSDGMLFYSVTQGVHGTMMIPREIILSEHQRWAVIHYIRTFAKPELAE